jgi:hypothetical protein
LKETCIKDAIKRSVPPHQLSCVYWPDSGRARQFVRRVTAERDKVRHLLWINAIPLLDLFGPDAREFAAPRRVQDSRAWRNELEGISITAGDYGSAACTLLSGDCRRREKSSASNPGALAFANPKAATKSGRTFSCSINSSSNSRAL